MTTIYVIISTIVVLAPVLLLLRYILETLLDTDWEI